MMLRYNPELSHREGTDLFELLMSFVSYLSEVVECL